MVKVSVVEHETEVVISLSKNDVRKKDLTLAILHFASCKN